jgi:hypothetical protein
MVWLVVLFGRDGRVDEVVQRLGRLVIPRDERLVGRLERGHGLSSRLRRKDESHLAVEGLQRAGEVALVGGEGRTGLGEGRRPPTRSSA